MSVPPNRLACTLWTAAFAVAAFAADAAHIASAQARLEADYTATLSGIPIGHGNWVVDVSEDQFSAAASGTTGGLLRLFSGARGSSVAHGSFTGGRPVPTSYAAKIEYDRKLNDIVRMVLVAGNVKDFSVEPPLSPQADRIPVTDADRQGVVDPLTAAINRVGGNIDLLSPGACNRKVAVFDGRVRYDLRNEFKRMEQVKADKGYAGPAVACAVYFTPISGYVPDRAAIKYLAALRDAEVWYAPIAGTRVLVPFRFSLPTPLGTGLLEATEFVSSAEPAHLGANTKTQ